MNTPTPPDNDTLRRNFLNSLEHAYIAYRYFVSTIPSDAMFANQGEVTIGNFRFADARQAQSMLVELGWAFFTRLEATLEAYVTRLGIPLGRQRSMLKYLRESGRDIREDFIRGLQVYRELRNTLHHGDGDPAMLNKEPSYLIISPDREPQLLPEHIDRFYGLFRWLGDELPATTDVKR